MVHFSRPTGLRRGPTLSRPVPSRAVRNRFVRFFLLLLAPTLVAGCSTKADIRGLQESMVELTAQQNTLLREIQAEQDAQADSLRAVTRALLDLRAESLRRMMSMEDQLLRVQELAGLSQQELARVRDELERDRAMASVGVLDGLGPEAAGVSSSAQETYIAARGQLERGQLTAARMGFEDVVATYANDPLVPEARFHLADILEQQGAVEEAITAFLEVQEYHPTAPRVPEALYRAALLHVQQGNEAEAERLLDRVVNTWPESLAADLARDALRDLR